MSEEHPTLDEGEIPEGAPLDVQESFKKEGAVVELFKKDISTLKNLRFCIDRHDGGINMCFLDSSVRKIPLYILWDLKWSREWVPQHYQQESIPWLR